MTLESLGDRRNHAVIFCIAKVHIPFLIHATRGHVGNSDMIPFAPSGVACTQNLLNAVRFDINSFTYSSRNKQKRGKDNSRGKLKAPY